MCSIWQDEIFITRGERFHKIRKPVQASYYTLRVWARVRILVHCSPSLKLTLTLFKPGLMKAIAIYLMWKLIINLSS